MEEENKKEIDKVWADVRAHNFGIFDQESKKRINPKTLAFFWRKDYEVKGIKEEVVLHTHLMRIKEIYRKKYGEKDPMEKSLLDKNRADFVERLIRAVEICTLEYALNKGGGLNLNPNSVEEGQEYFFWND